MVLTIPKNDNSASNNRDLLESDAFADWCVKSLESDIEVEFVHRVIKAFDITPNASAQNLENWPWPVKIYSLGNFALEINGKPLQFLRKAQKKPVDLLKALLALGSRNVNMETLAEILWPDAEGDDGLQSLATTLHRLRQLIGHDVVIRQQGTLSLSPEHCWTDIRYFEYLMSSASNELMHNHLDEAWQETEKVLELYKGAFLSNDSSSHWVLSMRERVRRKLLHHINTFGKRLCENDQYEQAKECYLKGLDIDDLQENFYRGLIICHKQLGQNAEAHSTYKKCHAMLTGILDMQPSTETKALIK